jgi:hypothetical protein
VSTDFPMRPLTAGEVLDAGVGLLRRRPVILLYAAVLAVAEQGLLHVLRAGFGVHRLSFDDLGRSFGEVWLCLSVGMGTEAAILALLGLWSGPAAARVLLGVPRLRLRRRILAAAVIVPLVAFGAALSFFLGMVAWIFWFMLTGLIVPVLTIDGGVPEANGRLLGGFAAFGRAIRFAAKSGLLAGRIRLLAYMPWLLLRFALNLTSGSAVTSLVGITSAGAATAVEYTLWTMVNALMYASIACIDAAALLETRMRVEGLDIAVHQAARQSRPVESALAAPR